jgi:hypothetical protein
MYLDEHHIYPYDSRGPEYALYRFSEQLGPRGFEGWHNIVTPFRFDNVDGKVMDPRVRYWNVPPEVRAWELPPAVLLVSDDPHLAAGEFFLIDTRLRQYQITRCRPIPQDAGELLGQPMEAIGHHAEVLWEHKRRLPGISDRLWGNKGEASGGGGTGQREK